MGLGSVLGAVAGIAGGLGKSKDKPARTEQQSGFRTLPKEIQEFMLQSIFPDIKDYQQDTYKGIPKRAINQEDLDPIFGSPARRDFAMQKAMAAMGASGNGGEDGGGIDQSTVDRLRDEMRASRWLSTPISEFRQQGDMAGSTLLQLQQMERGGQLKPEDYAALGRRLNYDSRNTGAEKPKYDDLDTDKLNVAIRNILGV